MDYLKFIEDYYKGNKEFANFLAINLFEFDFPNNMSNKKLLCAAKMGAISNIFLSIKENIVENIGNLNYESKLYDSLLEKSISLISKKGGFGYTIGNYKVEDVNFLVAFLRNKIAHGDFLIDFDKEEMIVNSGDKNFSININKLSKFVVDCLRNNFFYVKTSEYSRNITINDRKRDPYSKRLKTDEEIEDVIRRCTNIVFCLSRKDKKILEKYEIDSLNEEINKFRASNVVNFDLLQNLRNKYDKGGYILNISYNKLKKYNDIKELIPLIRNTIISQERYNYDAQILTISNEVQRMINKSYDEYNPLLANLTNLYVIDEIRKSGLTNLNSIVDTLGGKYDFGFYINYDNIVASLIGVFNSIYSIPLEKVYKPWDSEGFDFSKLQFGEVNIIKNDNKDGFFSEVNDVIKSKNKRLVEGVHNYLSILDNYYNAPIDKRGRIKNNLVSLSDNLERIREEIKFNEDKLKGYDDIDLYIKNKSIIMGIRNSISHGNYKVIHGDTFKDAKIVFSDIYEGEVTFEAEFIIFDFLKMLESNMVILNDYFLKMENSFKSRN